jgi:hypothetical protein
LDSPLPSDAIDGLTIHPTQRVVDVRLRSPVSLALSKVLQRWRLRLRGGWILRTLTGRESTSGRLSGNDNESASQAFAARPVTTRGAAIPADVKADVDMDEYLGIVHPLRSPFTMYARRTDLENAPDDAFMPFFAICLGRDKIVVRGDFQPSTGRVDYSPYHVCRFTLAQFAVFSQRWREAGFEVISQVESNKADPLILAAAGLSPPLTHDEYLTLKEYYAVSDYPSSATELAAIALIRKRFDPTGQRVHKMEAKEFEERLKEFERTSVRKAMDNHELYLQGSKIVDLHQYRMYKAWLAFLDGQLSQDELLHACRGVDIDALLTDAFHQRLGGEPIEHPEAWQSLITNVRKTTKSYELTHVNWAARLQGIDWQAQGRAGRRIGSLIEEFLRKIQNGQLYAYDSVPCPSGDVCSSGLESDLCDMYDPPHPVDDDPLLRLLNPVADYKPRAPSTPPVAAPSIAKVITPTPVTSWPTAEVPPEFL